MNSPKHLTPTDIQALTYHELCGIVDCGHPQERELLKEIEARRAARPTIRHYSELMR